MEEGRCSVLIIGAGLAGLACAKYLMDHDFDDLLVIEAQDRVGGRCQTIEFEEQYLELGADGLDGNASNNPLYRLAEEARMIDVDDNGSDRDDCYHDEDAESIDEDTIDEMRQVYDEILEKKLPTYPYENYPDLSIGEFISAEFEQYFELKKPRLDNEDLDERRKVLHWLNKQHPYLSTIPCNNLSEVSVQGWNSLERLPKDSECPNRKATIRQGFQHFIETSFQQIVPSKRIHLNSIVKRISVNENENFVDVEIVHRLSNETLSLRASHIVCTVSVGCLKQSMHQLFIPALPHAKRMSIQRLGFGTINRIYLIFSRPFWDVDFDGFHFLWNADQVNNEFKLKSLAKTSFDSRWCKSLRGFYVHHRLSNVLVTEIGGEAAKYMETMPDELISLAFQELLCHFYPDNPSPKAQKIIRSRWFNEPFIYGSHTYVKLGSSIHDIKQLATPWPNKPEKPLILFAGEGTHERFYGTTHGAFMSGIREGKRLLDFYRSHENA